MSQTSAAPVLDPLLSEEFRRAPHEVIARLREEDPVHLIPGVNAWYVTRYEDVRRLFTDPAVTNDQRAYEHYQAPPEGSYRRWMADNNPFSADPEQHARLRRLVSDGRQRPGRIRLGAASADGRAWTRYGATVGRGRARRGMALVVMYESRDIARVIFSILCISRPPRRHSFARVATSSGGR